MQRMSFVPLWSIGGTDNPSVVRILIDCKLKFAHIQ